jgi:hypothetical protein
MQLYSGLSDRIWCMASEGIMPDWSGLLKDVVQAPGELIVLGYISFMIMMATGRFFRRND